MEFIDVVDENGNNTGEVLPRNEIHKLGRWHNASGVIVVNSKKEILLQQRSRLKEKNAGLWDMSASGHIPAGQSPLQSLLREIEEEIGVRVEEKDLKLLGKYKRQELHNNGKFIENEFDFIYILNKDIALSQIQLQEEEVEDIKYVSTAEFKTMLKNGDVVKRVGVWDDLINCVSQKKFDK